MDLTPHTWFFLRLISRSIGRFWFLERFGKWGRHKIFLAADISEVLDLNGKGTGTYISDGVKEQVGWVKGDDGFLILDKNNNGVVDNVLELFGKQNKTGTEELREYDLNLDNQIYSSGTYANLNLESEMKIANY